MTEETSVVGLQRPTPFVADRQTVALTYGGMAFFLASLIALAVLAVRLYLIKSEYEPPNRDVLFSWFVAVYLGPVLLLAAAFFAAFVGYVLLRTAGAASREVIPRQDYELLSRLLMQNNATGIDQYIRLSSLGGFAGIFAKVGLSGLPLATIGLTLAFTIISLWGGKEVFDLAKLTLGAFIGSYVQRSVTERMASGEVRPGASSGGESRRP